MRRGRPGALMNLDLLALSLLCCLLASVVGILVAGAKPPAPPPIPPVDVKPRHVSAREELRQQTTRLAVQVREVEHSRETIATKLNYSVLERENVTLGSRAVQAREKVALTRLIQQAREEAARLTKELEERRRDAQAPLTPEARRMLGDYRGPYVLLECVRDAAYVHPGAERIPMAPSTEQLAKLVDRITRAGFVALVVRPSGWYENSYDNLRSLIYGELGKVEKATGNRVGRSTFPLDESEPITQYLPPETKP